MAGPLARQILIPALPAFYARYPDIQLDLGVSDRVVDMIGESVDCVIRGGEPRDLSLVARHLVDLPLGIYAAPAYLERVGRPDHPRALSVSPHQVVGFRWRDYDMTSAYTLHRGSETVSVRGRYVISVDDGSAGLAAGLAGLGVLWLPDYMANEHVQRGTLVRLFEA
ncbi:LysR substrate-binding domain-containing protein [Vreelandella malpeensis]|uniref:LysR substrate-binding domain-containing protein n=1 Tax=Vreelandella malpeensis TaxID=1172368 RepID=UPI001D0B042D|nr:LysR substrate-binding domain-containing protein [Halomonas malpeensis]